MIKVHTDQAWRNEALRDRSNVQAARPQEHGLLTRTILQREAVVRRG